MAQQLAKRNTEALPAAAAAGRPLLFCEPSCLSAVREDAPALLKGEWRAKAEVVAERSLLFEQAMLPALPRLTLKAPSGPRRFHGHCHQKSMGLLAPARALLARVPGASVIDLDAGCCGMAGSFGYAREHYDVSRQIGERRLLPAARAFDEHSVLVASGVSCRHQVADFAATRALHPAVLLRSLLTGAA